MQATPDSHNTASGLTPRSLILGIIQVLVVCLGAPYAIWVLGSSEITWSFFPISVGFSFWVDAKWGLRSRTRRYDVMVSVVNRRNKHLGARNQHLATENAALRAKAGLVPGPDADTSDSDRGPRPRCTSSTRARALSGGHRGTASNLGRR